MAEWPEVGIRVASDGWLVQKGTGRWANVEGYPNSQFETDKDGWLRWVGPVAWKWPEANDPPTEGNYQQRHPTRYTWRPDVERLARMVANNYDVSCNTYLDHPEGYWRDLDTIDVWGPGGRNDPIDPKVGQAVFDRLFYEPGKPDIDWIIWQRWMWTRAGGWVEFGYDPFTWHDDHIHVTYL